jgi:hypothetical protein
LSNSYISFLYVFIEENFEIKFPIIRIDGKVEMGRIREEKSRKEKIREEKE